jgi:hypothetical protein
MKTIYTRIGDTLFIESETITTVIKHNDVGISVDYYKKGDELKNEGAPFREDQVWWEDADEN